VFHLNLFFPGQSYSREVLSWLVATPERKLKTKIKRNHIYININLSTLKGYALSESRGQRKSRKVSTTDEYFGGERPLNACALCVPGCFTSFFPQALTE
jgi:hypothetical protein